MEASHCSFNLHFQDRIMVQETFHVLLCQSYIFLGEMSLQIFGPLISLDLSPLLSFESCLYILDTSSLSDGCFANIFLLVYYLRLKFLNSILQREKVLNFGEVQLMNFFFYYFFSVTYIRHLCLNPWSHFLFSSVYFIVLFLTLWLWSIWVLIFVFDVRQDLRFVPLHMDIQLF